MRYARIFIAADHLEIDMIKDEVELKRVFESYPEVERKIFDFQELRVTGCFTKIGGTAEKPTSIIVRIV
jgi:hypothetical protein